jgi:2-dehydro-3-deoxyphosphogluconate aldolase/(4S)-4-hydroxy-2-oxoglutarate aldolase
MLILRGIEPERAVAIARTSWEAGVGLVEVPLQTERDVEALRGIVRAAEELGRPVGAGTVIDVAIARAARDAGAVFTVAPGFDPRVLDASLRFGMAHLPGVGSGTDIQCAISLGCETVKAFPACVLGPEWIRAMRGPFPSVGIVATGGVSSANARAFFDAGANAIAVGAALEDPDELRALLDIISQSASISTEENSQNG